MSFVFSRRFYILLAIAVIPLSLSWSVPELRYVVLAFDIVLIAAAIVDYFIGRKLPDGFTMSREFEKRFAIGDRTKISILIDNAAPRRMHLRIKDEYPSEMTLNQSREAEFTVEANGTAEFFYHLTPPRRGRFDFGSIAVRQLSPLGLIWVQTSLGDSADGQGLSKHAAST